MDFSKLAKSLNPYTIKKGFSYLKQYGFQEFKERIWEYPPLISVVVPIYKTPEVFLRQMIESVTAQTYPHWQLCIADGSGDTAETKRIVDSYLSDKRIKYKILAENLGIADNTNAAMELADGDYIALFDHDDLLSENALYEVADRICKTGAEIVYTDEDKVTSDLSERYQPNFKPDFNLDLLRSNNYICHLLVVKKTLVQEVGGQKKEFDGAQDHEFLFRCVEKAKGIEHIPKVLYHWRVHKASTADNPLSKKYAYDAGKRAVTEHIRRCGEEAEVTDTLFPGFYRAKRSSRSSFRTRMKKRHSKSVWIPLKRNQPIVIMRSLLWRITAPGRRFLIITKRLTAGTASGSFTGSRALIILP